MASKTLYFDLFGRDRTASKTMRGVGKSVGLLNRQFAQLGGVIGAALSVRAIVNYGKEAVGAFLEAEQAQTKLIDAYNRFPALADTNIEDLRKLNKATMLKTGFDDDALAVAQATLAQYKLTGSQIKTLTPLVADYARKTGKDLPSAATTLGKALLGQGRALKEIGINFKDTGSVAGNFDQLVGGLTEKVGGFAETFGKTDAGKLEIFKARLQEVQEVVGGSLLDAFSRMNDSGVIDDLVGSIETVAPALGDVIVQLGEFTTDWTDGIKELANLSVSSGWDKNWRDFWAAAAPPPSMAGPMDKALAEELAGRAFTAQHGGEAIGSKFLEGINNSLKAGTIGPETQKTLDRAVQLGLLTVDKNGRYIGAALVDGIASGIDYSPSAENAAKGMSLRVATASRDVIVNDPQGPHYIGSMLVDGIADGIRSNGAAELAAILMTNKVAKASRTNLGIHSPSKVFRQIGGHVAQGFADGVNAGAPASVRAVGSLVSIPDVAGSASSGATKSGGGDLHLHFTGLMAGTEAGLAKQITLLQRNAVKTGQIPAGYSLA